MKKRFMKVTQILVLGCCFQFAGCQSTEIANIVASSFKGTVVDIGTFLMESVLDNAIPIE